MRKLVRHRLRYEKQIFLSLGVKPPQPDTGAEIDEIAEVIVKEHDKCHARGIYDYKLIAVYQALAVISKSLTARKVDAQSVDVEALKMNKTVADLDTPFDHGYMAGYNAAIDHLAAAGHLKAQTWLPIETAPKTGARILLSVPAEQMDFKSGRNMVVIGYHAPQYSIPAHDDVWEPEKYPNSFEYNKNDGEWYALPGFYYSTFETTYGDEIARAINPTHWMPLPPAPAADDREA